MKQESYELFKSATVDEITAYLANELKTKNEPDFWASRVVPFSDAILSVLVVLRDEKKLFSPEGEMVEELTPELFFRWSDFVSLKSLAFKIQRTNRATDESKTEIDLSKLASYLSANNVNLENEQLDFPIPTYNLHQGVSNVIKSLL
ncbi:hypothetical protein M947_11645 [Sulfurimonas hongkongensis]|uniref:Uncharacterized protein n=1 Tax=Sulfurimonas hongkongensis TaxID=1172190 RepID=T0KC31_9BACT|nr:hypothetical protein [Sulfurimonas hongkongensis]EQB34284.1 hypothetical protein M947_11645 [Sulfurimonas hongkongensis]